MALKVSTRAPVQVWSSPGDLQIAPAEGPDVSERMVIITGPPEAQFKVSAGDLGGLGGLAVVNTGCKLKGLGPQESEEMHRFVFLP